MRQGNRTQPRSRRSEAEQIAKRKVPLVSRWIDGVDIAPGQIKLLENVRWIEGEGMTTMRWRGAWQSCATCS